MWTLIFRGLATGSIYSLTAMGIVLVLSTTNVMNFAQGDMGMFLAFIAFALLMRHVSYPIAIIAVVLIGLLLGALLERGLMSKVRKTTSHLGMLIVTLALTMILEGLAGYFFGTTPLLFPPLVQGAPLQFLGIILDRQDLVSLAIAGVVVLILFIVLYRTKIGIASRSLAEDEYAARLLGIPIKNIYIFIWAASFGLAGLAGIMVAPKLSLEPSFMIVIQLKAFIAAVLGGMNSVVGAVVGGLLLGVLENFVAYYIPQIKDSFSLILVVAVLLVLPEGIFGKRAARRA
ncbi:MAG: branched-chain amino acid ABC transporter permease [Candidatus Cryosericum sp.]|nr:branched-chain amino acid ABC transporter permease [bacterium]